MKYELPVSGWELKKVREMCCYSAREFGEYLQRKGIQPGSVRGIYYLEDKQEVGVRYVVELASMIGQQNFAMALKLVRNRHAEQERDRKEYLREREAEMQRRQAEQLQKELARQQEVEQRLHRLISIEN